MKLLWVVLTFGVCMAAAKNDPTCTDTPYCDPNTCKLPDCACTDTEPDVPVGERPQIVYLTFDDGISKLFDDQYFSQLFMSDANGNYSMFYNFLTSILKISSQIYPNGPDLLLWD